MITSKGIAEKIHMFYNLLYHLDDYIKNKKERKGQLRVSKNIRLILREIISSKTNLNYFINKEELDSYRDLLYKKNDEIFQREKNYIKTINPLSFNQKNLNTINLFYNSNDEAYVLNYLCLEKILSIIKFCFIHIIKQKNKEIVDNFEKKHKNDFALYHIYDEDKYSNNENEKIILSNKNQTLRKILKNNLNIKERYVSNTTKKNNTLQLYRNKTNRNNILKISDLLNNNYNNINNISLYNVLSSPNRNPINKALNNINNYTSNNSSNELKKQLNKINNQINLSLIKANSKKFLSKNNFKKNISLPLIIGKKRSGFSNERNKSNNSKDKLSYVKKENIFNNQNNFLLSFQKFSKKNKEALSNFKFIK